MANKLIEVYLTAIQTYLQTNLAAELTALQAAYADGIVLTAPRATDYSIYELGAIDQLPFIQILPNNSDIVGTGLQHDMMDHNIIIVSHVPAPRGRNDYCALRTYRFAEAIWRLITSDRTLTGLEIWCTNINYEPMMQDNNTLKGEVRISVTVKGEERI